MKQFLVCALSVTAMQGMPCHAQGTPATLTQDALVRLTQARMDAVAPGNAKPFEQQFYDDALIFDERGRAMDKARLLKEITPVAAGDIATLKVIKPQSRIEGKVAVFAYDIDETEIIFGQVNKARYHETDTWLERNGEWKIIAEQVLRYYADPAPGVVDVRRYPKYLGRYQLGPKVTLAITRDGSKLYAQEIGKQKRELIPEATDIFFSPGVEGRELFKYDDKGDVVAYIERRNNEDLVWKKLK
ncbi:MAG: nuclear transport factor 2 family protein [Steroidobacteraceae bacterium]